MSDLMIGNNSPLFRTHDPIFLLFTDQYHFHCLKKIFLTDDLSAILYRIDRSLIDHIGEIRSYRTGCRQCDFFQVHTFIHLDIFCMDF